MKKAPTIFAIDFDGTCVTHDYPEVGKNIGAQEVLNKLVKNGHKLILWTMRSGQELKDAEDWFKANNIPLWGVQRNPEQHTWTQSPKAYAQVYIDDAALGCPLTHDKSFSHRPFVNWGEIETILTNSSYI
jgi:hypothetical protein